MAAAGVAGALPAPRRPREPDHRSGQTRADRGARHPAGLARGAHLGAPRQATGLDAAGRRQFLYQEDHRASREQEKYDRLIRFAERLPELRAVMSEHMELGPVIEQYLDGRTIEDFRPRHLRVIGARDIALDQEEQALLSLLRSWRIRRARAESEAA